MTFKKTTHNITEADTKNMTLSVTGLVVKAMLVNADYFHFISVQFCIQNESQLEMWANSQRNGRPAVHRWRPLFNAAKFG